MSARDDGGRVFPLQDPQAIHAVAAAEIADITGSEERERAYIAARAKAISGVSLRDYFAAKAMVAFIGVPATASDLQQAMLKANATDPMNLMATNAYAMADEMLKVRAT